MWRRPETDEDDDITAADISLVSKSGQNTAVQPKCPGPNIQGVFFHWYPPKKLKYGKPR